MTQKSDLGNFGEDLFQQRFPSAVRMRAYNRGYDFLLNTNRISVKVASHTTTTIRKYNRTYNRWYFGLGPHVSIRSDILCCIAVDNSVDKNTIHVWVIPSVVLNNKVSLVINNTLDHINKWRKYERSCMMVNPLPSLIRLH